jgi:hypothetical protein
MNPQGLFPLMLRLFLSLFLVFAAACGKSGSDLPIADYHQAVQPLMYENRQLADSFTDLAGRIHLEQVTGDEVAGEFESKLIPLAERLQNGAKRIKLRDGPLARVHAGLIEAWELRATSYSEMLAAYQASDTSIFEKALKGNSASKQKEELYFGLANKYFATENLRLFQFPETN